MILYVSILWSSLYPRMYQHLDLFIFGRMYQHLDWFIFGRISKATPHSRLCIDVSNL